MNWEDLTRHDKSIQLIRALKSLSQSDGSVSDEELQYIRRVGQQQRLMLSEIDEELASDNSDIKYPKSERDRMEVLYHLVFLMKSDTTIEPEEEVSIKHFGLKLGFREELITDFIKLANKFKNSNMPSEFMIDKIKKFMN